MNAEDSLAEELPEDDPEYTPRVVVLGAGPMGLETALYARYLGFNVAVLEKDIVASNVLRWGHVRMFSPFAMNRSSLGVAAMQAQFDNHPWPKDDALLSGREYAERYLQPLAKTDLLTDCVHEHVEVLKVARDGILKTDTAELVRSDYPFRILVRTPEGEDVIEADFVIDTTGVFDHPNWFGHGGMPARGELGMPKTACVFRHVPDVLGDGRRHFENKRVLVVGNGYSAATSIITLQQLHQQAPQTQVTWVTRREAAESGPMPVRRDDKLAERQRLVDSANEVSRSATSGIELADQTSILEINCNDDNTLNVALRGKRSGDYRFDTVVALTGYRPNNSLSSELQVGFCKSSDATQSMGDWIAGLGAIDALNQSLPGAQVLQSGETNFFVLGSKSFGRNSNFLLSLGLEQIRLAFTIIADRKDLDLYATMTKLTESN